MDPFFNKYEKYLPEISADRQHQLESFFKMLYEIARVRGYIGDGEKEVLWLRHIFDSIVVLKEKKVFEVFNTPGTPVIDLGTGAGLPGIPLAVLFPELQFHLVETLQKRVAFLEEAIEQLGLKNIVLYNKRIEDITSGELKLKKGPPPLVIFRAFLKPLVSLELSLYVMEKNSKVLYWRSKRFDQIRDDKERLSVAERDARHQFVNQQLKNLGISELFFTNLEVPELLGNRGVYLFGYNGKPEKGFPRKWLKIKRDNKIQSIE